MKFEYLDVEQRSPEWFGVRMGKVTASRLSDWMAVSKAKGEPLQKRKDYERELWFERQFGVSFNNYISQAMLEGQALEDYVRFQYQELKGVKVDPCGIFYNEHFAATPDGLIGDDGLLEVKVLRDNSFTKVLLNGVPEEHFLQVQGQLLASGRKWCDYVAFNLNTKKFAVWRVLPNLGIFENIESSVQEPITVEDVSTDELHDIVGQVPEIIGAEFDSFNEGATSW